MNRRGERQGRNILLVVGFIAGWATSHFGFVRGPEAVVFLALVTVVVFLVSAVLGRMVVLEENRIPWSHIGAGTGLFVGAGVVSYLIFGRFPAWVKEAIGLLIALSVLTLLVHRNFWAPRRPASRSSQDVPDRRG